MSDYTFRLTCSFSLQHTFSAVAEQAGGVGVVPTERALTELVEELEAALGTNHAISGITLYVEPTDLLGVNGKPV